MHYFLRDQWLGTDEEVRAHIPGGEPVNPAGSFTWLKLGSAQTLLQQEGIFKWPLMTSALLSLLEGIFRIVPPLLKCVLSHIKCPKTWHPTSTLPCSSHLSSCFTSSGSCSTAFSFSSSHPLFPALHFITLLSHSNPSLSCCYFSPSTTSYPYSCFHPFTLSLSQNVLYSPFPSIAF